MSVHRELKEIIDVAREQGTIIKRDWWLRRQHCPACHSEIKYPSILRFQRLLLFRKPAPCPYCGTHLIFSKWPSRLISASIIEAGILITLYAVLKNKYLSLFPLAILLAMQLLAFFLYGGKKMSLVLYAGIVPDEKDTSDT